MRIHQLCIKPSGFLVDIDMNQIDTISIRFAYLVM